MNISTTSRTVPFATFMVFIGINELLLLPEDTVLTGLHLYLYPARIVFTGLLLAIFRKQYDEIQWRDLLRFRDTTLSLIVGIVVFVLWINMPWTTGAVGAPAGYDPTAVSENFTRVSLITIRLLGASVVVPIMEELFWRSFLVRYVINPRFLEVSVGHFTWPSFLIGTILFGLEHHLFFAGVMAGIAYSLLLYRTRSLVCCILAHGVTNLALGAYVLISGKWEFW